MVLATEGKVVPYIERKAQDRGKNRAIFRGVGARKRAGRWNPPNLGKILEIRKFPEEQILTKNMRLEKISLEGISCEVGWDSRNIH